MSSHHNKTDSEVTSSLAPSSPNRPVYYVQSPSRDSHDGEKTTNSFHSTPIISPAGSPGRHSRGSSSTRFSGSLKPGSQKSTSRHHDRRPRKSDRHWKEFDAIEEEGLLVDDRRHNGFPRRCYFLAFLVGFFMLFGFFSLILWGASRNQKPHITLKSISFDQFGIHAGMDNSGVATEMVSMNSTVKLLFRNTGTFFGVHVTSTPFDLSFSEITVASGAEVLSIPEKSEDGDGDAERERYSVVRRGSEPEQRRRETDGAGAVEAELHGSSQGVCTGQVGEATVREKSAVLGGYGAQEDERGHIFEEIVQLFLEKKKKQERIWPYGRLMDGGFCCVFCNGEISRRLGVVVGPALTDAALN
nr:uncharacterized protein LOC109180419 [Ipomoea batatas]